MDNVFRDPWLASQLEIVCAIHLPILPWISRMRGVFENSLNQCVIETFCRLVWYIPRQLFTLVLVDSSCLSTSACLVAWPWIEEELELTLFWYKPHCFAFVNHIVYLLTSFRFHVKNSEICIEKRLLRKTILNWLFNNWFMRQRAFIDIWSTREVWRARKMRKSCSRRSRG